MTAEVARDGRPAERPAPGPAAESPPPASGGGSRWRLRPLAVLLGVAAAVAGVDHLTKWLVVQHVALHDQVPASGPVTIHHIENQGAAFGLFPQLQYVFLGAAVLVSAYILLLGPRLGGLRVQAVLGLILGGAAANALDRIVQGYVIDFVDLQRWPVFNVADACIVVGIGLAVLFVGAGRPVRARGGADRSG